MQMHKVLIYPVFQFLCAKTKMNQAVKKDKKYLGSAAQLQIWL